MIAMCSFLTRTEKLLHVLKSTLKFYVAIISYYYLLISPVSIECLCYVLVYSIYAYHIK